MKKKRSGFCTGERWSAFKAQLNNVSPEEARTLLRSDELVVLDVRTAGEHREKCIPGSLSMDYLSDNFIDELLALDRSRPYLVYCRTGRRSLRVCTWMKNSGFERLFHLEGGLDAWTAANGD